MNYSIYSKKALDVVNCQQLLSVYLLSVTASESNLQLASKFIELGLSCVFSSPSPVIYALLCDVCIDLEMINVQIIVALRFKVLNEIDVLLLGRCLVSFGIYDLERTGVIIDHFPVSKCLFECVKEIANHVDAVPSLYFLNHILDQLERKDQVVAALRMNNIVANVISSIQREVTAAAAAAANDTQNTSDLLELSLELLNRIALISKPLFPPTTTLFLLGLQYLHSICNRTNSECYYHLSEPLNEADCVNNWLLLLNSFVEGQSQRISMQCASFLIQYMPSILKVLISLIFLLFISFSSSFTPRSNSKYFYC